MANTALKKHLKKSSKEKAVLVLQGGGALGSYQAGVYAGLHAQNYDPSWIAGISIGSINAAIIAGNTKEKRLEKLRCFWEIISSGLQGHAVVPGEFGRLVFNEASSALATMFGIPGFFKMRIPPGIFYPAGAPEALSIYDTTPLRQTLLELVDFDLLNTGRTRLSVGAVNIRTGNFEYFDSENREITPDHIMASCAIPPGFPPVEIDGELYWDGGIVSNTPLQYVIDSENKSDNMCIFQVDLFSANGNVPKNLFEVEQREKDIRFSSRTRLGTDVFKDTQRMRGALERLLTKLPNTVKNDPDFKLLKSWSCEAGVTIVHLINRHQAYHTESKDYEFSRLTVNENWKAGEGDVNHVFHHKKWLQREIPKHGVKILDLNK